MKHLAYSNWNRASYKQTRGTMIWWRWFESTNWQLQKPAESTEFFPRDFFKKHRHWSRLGRSVGTMESGPLWAVKSDWKRMNCLIPIHASRPVALADGSVPLTRWDGSDIFLGKLHNVMIYHYFHPLKLKCMYLCIWYTCVYMYVHNYICSVSIHV